MFVIPGLPGRYKDGAELAFWLARGCSFVLTVGVGCCFPETWAINVDRLRRGPKVSLVGR